MLKDDIQILVVEDDVMFAEVIFGFLNKIDCSSSVHQSLSVSQAIFMNNILNSFNLMISICTSISVVLVSKLFIEVVLIEIGILNSIYST